MPARRHRRHHRPQRRRQIDPVPHDPGQEQPDSGEIDIGPTVKIASSTSPRRPGDRQDRVRRTSPAAPTSSPSASFEMPSRAYIGRFNFKGGDQQQARRQPVRRRARPPAPGQDPDPGRQRAAARRTVQRPRRGNPARAGRRAARIRRLRLVISHDRWFLDRIATHILACEGDSQWTFFAGNYQEYEADKKETPGRGRRQAEADSLQADLRRIVVTVTG
jgi:sulfate-transporting ATPase